MRTTCAGHVDGEMIAEIVTRNNLRVLDMSQSIHGGDCPFCGHPRSFCLWSDKGNFRCYWCGCDGRFVRTPEREAEKRAKHQAYLDSIGG